MTSSAIRRLPPDIVTKIAAGEVIENPASAVKELVENALDAAATSVMVALEAGGKKLIRVADDGYGIPPDELALACLPHATSKLRAIDELEGIATMGFRGEALSSIAAVSDFRLETKHRGATTGRRLEPDERGGFRIEEIPRARGTTVQVRNLFARVPARLKFMGTERSESNRCSRILVRLALAHPEVGFRFEVDRREALHFVPGDGASRLEEVFGQRAREMTPITGDLYGVGVSGFAGAPEHGMGRSDGLYCYVNGRSVVHPMLVRAFAKAYGEGAAGRYPIGVLFLRLGPGQVDVNVHPSKREVRFRDERAVFRAVLSAVRTALAGRLHPVPEMAAAFEKSAGDGVSLDLTGFEDSSERPGEFAGGAIQADLFESPRDAAEVLPGGEAPLPSPWAQAQPGGDRESDSAAFLPVHGRFICFEVQSGLMVVDAHRAHQRVLYEQAMDNLRARARFPSQGLLFPEVWEAGGEPAQRVVKHLEELKTLGFDIEAFGGNTFQIRGIPTDLMQGRSGQAVLEILEELEGGEAGDSLTVLARAYARGAAWRRGEKLASGQVSALMNRLFATRNPYVSPWGKPVSHRIRPEELDRLLERH